MSRVGGADALATVNEVGDVPAGKLRGFAAMKAAGRNVELLAIASKGGTTSHRLGRAHEWTSETARAAGSKGGKATWAKKRAVER